jgi:peptidoglycan/LPS O-acetylase OafA/YrhL
VENKRLDYMDALRGIAVLCVIAIHSSQYGNFDVPETLKHIIGTGARGVQLFYLVSAFTLCFSFSQHTLNEKKPVRNFFIRRFFRIAPMYYILILVYFAAYSFAERYGFSVGAKSYWGNANIITVTAAQMLFVHGLHPQWINSLVPAGWSVAVEMMFYVFFPFIFARIKNLSSAFNFLIITLFIRLLFNVLLSNFNPVNSEFLWNEYLFFYLPNQLPVFALGILAYYMIIAKDTLSGVSMKALLVFSLCVLAQLASGINMFFANHILFGAGFLLLAVALSRYASKLFVNPLFIYLGKISYSVYLVHPLVLVLLAHLGFIDYADNGIINYLLRYLVVIAVSSAIATLSYSIVEKPFQKLGRKLIRL